jgi:hypothetical protein
MDAREETTDLSVIMDLRKKYIAAISTGYGRHMARPVGPCIWSKLKWHP